MLPLLKKKAKAPVGPAVPAWHPNFRDYSKLPDVKVVRTAFFVNGIAIAVTLALAAYFGIEEWQLHTLRAQVAAAHKLIERDRKPSGQLVEMFKKFEGEAVKVREVDAFVKSKPEVSEILLRLARTLPPNIALDSFDLRENGLSLHLTVRGSPEAAAGYATAYLDQLRADNTLTAFDHNKFEFTSQARDATSGRLVVEFLLHWTAAAGGKHP